MKVRSGKRFLYSVERYVEKCRTEERIPNRAGYLRYLGITADEYKALEERFCRETEIADAIFEDEALNMPPKRISAGILSLYLKSRFGYGAESAASQEPEDDGSYQIIVDGDGYEDGE